MTVKGDLKLEIDEQGIEVRITITPDENGAEISLESLQAMLAEKKVRTGIDTTAMDRAFRALARKKSEPVTFIAASGSPPQPGTPESAQFESLSVPPRLAGVAQRVLAAAESPRGFRLREDKIKRERKVLKKAALPFLPAKQQVETVFEKKLVREDVEINPAVTETGFVSKGSLVARIRPGKQGKEGKSVFGRLVPAPRPDQDGFLFCAGLTRGGADVMADITGFLRKGANWCDIVPFRDHAVAVAASPDRLTCLLSFTPGDAAAPPPDTALLLSNAAALGFPANALLPEAEIAALLQRALAKGNPIVATSITPAVNGIAVVNVSQDSLKAALYLRKGRGGGTALTPAAASDAIKASGVKGFNAEVVRRDLRAFFAGGAAELIDYVLVTGKAPKQGSERKIQWRALFLPEEEARAIRAAGVANAGKLKGLSSLAAFPPDRVEAVARVKAGTEILSITPSVGSEPGVDVYGAALAPSTGDGAQFRLFEGCAQRKDMVVATEAGILEKGSEGMTILLRVRPHKDAELRVSLTPDRMHASLSYSPPEGDGAVLGAENVRSLILQAGVKRGTNEEKLLDALDAIARGKPLIDFLIAEGRKPTADAQRRIVFHVALATGKAMTMRKDGSADYRAQDRITRVRDGELIATVRPRDPSAEDGWDVTGIVIPVPADQQETLQAGPGVREDLQADGSVRFTAEAGGELVRDGAHLSVMEAHVVNGDVDLTAGNVSFPGNVRVTGTVRSGFSVVAGGVLEVGEAVEAALLSAGGSITVEQGIKGEGKAVLRSKRGISAAFAEQAVLLAIGTVRLRAGCVRCQVKCNGKLVLDSEKGILVGGAVRASRGVEVQSIGSPGGVHTIVSFGQDFLVKDQIEREEKEIIALNSRVADMDAEMTRLESGRSTSGAPAGPSPEAAALAKARATKVALLKLLEQRKLRLVALHDRYDEHVESEVVVRGTLYPGAVLESHGRRYETRAEKKMITLWFDPAQGKIVEKL